MKGPRFPRALSTGARLHNPVRSGWVEKAAWRSLMLVAIPATIWVARYWHFASFGLYEDDWTVIPDAVAMSFAELARFIINYIIQLSGHARPLSNSFIYLAANLGWRLGGLQGIYWIGYATVVFNAVLFYLLLKRLGGHVLAAPGTLAYCLFSADTTQAFLTHSIGLQPSLLLLLLATHAYLSGKKLAAYLLVVAILFAYETPFLVFLAVPVLKPWDRKLVRECLAHAAVLAAMLAAVFMLRFAVDEERIYGLSLQQLLLTPLLHMLQGPVVSLGTYLYRPIQALRSFNLEAYVVALVSFPALWWLLGHDRSIQPLKLKPIRNLAELRKWLCEIPEQYRLFLRLAAAGLLMLILAYPLTYTVRAYAISGRDTRVHFAAAPGAALLIGSLVSLLPALLHSPRWRSWLSGLVALDFALLLGYGFIVQRDYILAWDAQRQFWQNILRLAPDLQDGTLILVEPDGVPRPRQIGANTWTTPRLLEEIFIFPGDWHRPPRAYLLEPGWQQHLAPAPGEFRLDQATSFIASSEYLNFDSSQVIWIETRAQPGQLIGQFTRRTQPLVLEGAAFPLKQAGTPSPAFEPGPLYRFLIAP